MKFTKIPATTFQELQLNAGVLAADFDPATAALDAASILGATSGGVNFSATPSFTDFGADIDNCPNNTMELKKQEAWDVSMSGTFVTLPVSLAKTLVGSADVSGTKVTPRQDLQLADFQDIWWIGDYSDKNGAANGGFIAIHMLNSLSTGGFSVQSGKNTKGQFAFTFTGHYSINEPETVPFEVYVKAGEDEV